MYKELRQANNDSVSRLYSRARNRVTAMLRYAKKNYFHRLKDANNADLWKAIKHLNKNPTTIPNLNLHNGEVATTPVDKANALNLFFASCFNQSSPPLSRHNSQDLVSAECPEELLCTEDEVLEMLLALDTTKANGPDGISGTMLKYTATSIAPVLTKLFNLSIKTGTVPTAWKISTVVPIPKGKAGPDLTNYRPISLLSICSKMLERHVAAILSYRIQDSCPLSASQWGFMPRKSTTTALLSVLHNWHLHLEANTDICAVFFDLRKAFNSVPRRPLVQKLEQLGINKFLLKWTTNYLTEMKQQVVVSGGVSTPVPVMSGVPQGSVLGPLLFIIYVDGVSSITLADGTVVLFADDMVLYRPLYTPYDYELLQRDINAIAHWISNVHLQFNTKNRKYMVLSRKHSNAVLPSALTLDDLPLDKVSEFKYLGIHITPDLNWSLHIDRISAETKRLVGMFHRRFFSTMDADRCRQLYITYIRPHLEYACQVWDPHLRKCCCWSPICHLLPIEGNT